MPISIRPPTVTGQGVPSPPEMPENKSKIVIRQHRYQLGVPKVKAGSPTDLSLVDRILSTAKLCLSTLGKLFRELHHQIGAAARSIKASIISALSHSNRSMASKVDSVSPLTPEQKDSEEIRQAPVTTWRDHEEMVTKKIDDVSKLPQEQILKRLFILKKLKDDLDLLEVGPSDSSAKLQKMEEMDQLIKSIETDAATIKHPLLPTLEIAFAIPSLRDKVIDLTSRLSFQDQSDLSLLSKEELNEIDTLIFRCVGSKEITQDTSLAVARVKELASAKMLINTVKEALFQNELNAAPKPTRQAFVNIQKILGEKFSIPVDIKFELITEIQPLWYVAQILATSAQDLDKLNFKGLCTLGTLVTEIRKTLENEANFTPEHVTPELREKLKTVGEYSQKIENRKEIVFNERLHAAAPEIKNVFQKMQRILGENTPIPTEAGCALLDLLKSPSTLNQFNAFIDKATELKKVNAARFFFKLDQKIEKSANDYHIPYAEFVISAPFHVQNLLHIFSQMLALKVGANPITQFINDGLELGEISIEEALKTSGPCYRSAMNILDVNFVNKMQLYDHMSPGEKILISKGFIPMPGKVFIRNEWTGKGTGKPTLEFSVAALTKPPKQFDQRAFNVEIDFESLSAFNLNHQTRREILHFIGMFEQTARKLYNQDDPEFDLHKSTNKSERERKLILDDAEFWKQVDNPEEFGPPDDAKKALVLKRMKQLYDVATKFKDEMEPKFFTALMELGSIDN